MRYFVFLFFIQIGLGVYSQADSTAQKLEFTADFRFRVEQDWNSQKSDGTIRQDRTRLRYRLRFGIKYAYNDWASFGMRIRTGQWNKQQDAQLTLGSGFKEFGSLPIGLDKAFLKIKHKKFSGWLGKNSFPFKKQNELFWSDNVSPEGVFMAYKFNFKKEIINQLKISAGHFIVNATGGYTTTDAYFQGVQIYSSHWKKRIQLFPSYYYFHEMPNIPDGFETMVLNYSIFHLGSAIKILKNKPFFIELDYYHNLNDYSDIETIKSDLRNQNEGFVGAISYGKLKEKGNFMVKATYTYLERFAAVDFLCQNDWVRWDYGSIGSPDGRLTNFQGIEFLVGYAINKKFTLKTRFFLVEQLISYGDFKENGSRIRLDLDIGF